MGRGEALSRAGLARGLRGCRGLPEERPPCSPRADQYTMGNESSLSAPQKVTGCPPALRPGLAFEKSGPILSDVSLKTMAFLSCE